MQQVAHPAGLGWQIRSRLRGRRPPVAELSLRQPDQTPPLNPVIRGRIPVANPRPGRGVRPQRSQAVAGNGRFGVSNTPVVPDGKPVIGHVLGSKAAQCDAWLGAATRSPDVFAGLVVMETTYLRREGLASAIGAVGARAPHPLRSGGLT